MEMKELSVEDITKLVAVGTGLLSLATKLGFLIADVIRKSKEISEEDKEEMIARIKAAQASVPEWK